MMFYTSNSQQNPQLYIDDRLVVDNDGIHGPLDRSGSVELSLGIHRVRVPYFQDPRFQVALVLRVSGPGQPLEVFSTDEFKPPEHPESWPELQKP